MFLLLFREEGGSKTERDRETSIDSLLYVPLLTGDWTHNLDKCPDQESNPQPFGVQDDTLTNSATSQG